MADFEIGYRCRAETPGKPIFLDIGGRVTIMKVIIVVGVAGGASCAARLRRLDKNAEII